MEKKSDVTLIKDIEDENLKSFILRDIARRMDSLDVLKEQMFKERG